ncbi:MAG: EAL domain-containing protein [Clostridiales bacterium]|nr:EAL domain-containing protein [Clostridiales bacterium]
MNEFNTISLSFTIAALLVSLSDILFTKIQGRMGKKQNFLFMCLLIVVAVNSACNTITDICRVYFAANPAGIMIGQTARYLYYVFHTMLAPLFFFYVARVCGVSLKTNQLKSYIYHIVFFPTELMVLLNPLTGWVFEMKGDLSFERNFGVYIIYVVAAFFMIVAMGYLMTTWKALTVKRRTGIIMFSGITLIGIVLQLAFSNIKVELFAEALGLTGIMIIIENEEDRIDNNTGVYNRQALIMDLNSYIIHKNPLYAMCVRITTPDMVTHRADLDNNEAIERVVAEYLSTVVERYNVYKVGSKNFVIIVFNRKGENAMDVAKEVAERFEKPWRFEDTVALLTVAIQVTEIPGRINNIKDALYMFDSLPPLHSDKKIYVGSDLDYLFRKFTVEKSISGAISSNKLEVYYQPTYSIDGLTLHGAEALIRLHDDSMGMIGPDEFIPIAEENGLIDSIDDFVLLEVCKLIKEEELYKYIDCINVNLSVMQCLEPGFVDHIKGIVEEAGIDKKYINFEITESLSASNYEILNGVITSLKDDGFKFSLDDYGTGYSNMRALASMDLDVIKIDKSILWEAEKNEFGEIILENNIRMIHQMNRKILVEGVETKAQIELLKPLGVNYLQGYYFSKPVPKDQFLKIIRGESGNTGNKEDEK